MFDLKFFIVFFEDGDCYVFWFNYFCVYYVKFFIVNFVIFIFCDVFFFFGICLGKFIKMGKFCFYIIVFFIFFQGVCYKIWIKENGV